ncbi:sulfurtransferase [Salinicoccus carnicancri]|uniref:sulfurtransferase n=1 Tax=Salinicoccus carnicancri TaxID=558170 RepID=UPI0002FF7909|nr:rhodanese-like domain-containing protein [Salinicoccus carnicancri]
MIIDAKTSGKLGKRKLTLADCRNVMDNHSSSVERIEKSPVEGSVHISQVPWMFTEDGMNGGRHPIPNSGVIDTLYDALGGGTNDIILFADENSFFHTRLYYLFRLYGHNVFLWNDSVQALESLTTDRDAAAVPLEDVSIQAGNREVSEDIFRSMEDVQARAGRPHVLLIDVRSRNRYLGLEEPIDSRKGHIPSAINIPLPTIHKDGVIDFGALRYMRTELEKYREIIVYCGSGMSATPMFVLLDEMRLPVKLYGGSFSEWITDSDNAVETGDTRLNERMGRIYG